MENLKRNTSIDAVKGIAIVLVMLGHVFVHNHMEDPYLYDAIRAVQMPLFMIVSGYLSGQGRKITDLQSYGRIIRKRAVSYLIPFFSWLTLMHLTDLSAAYRRIFFELDFGLWFLAVLFILVFMVSTAQLLCAGCKRKSEFWGEVFFWIIFGAECLIPLLQIRMGNKFLSPYLTINYIPFYMMGYAAGNYGKKFFVWDQKVPGKISCKNSPVIRAGSLLSGLIFCCLAAVWDLNSMESKPDLLIQLLASFLGSAVIIYGVCRMREGRIKGFLSRLGCSTLEIYVIHYHFASILNFGNRQYDFYTPEGFMFVWANFTVMGVLTFVCIRMIKKVKLLDFVLFGKRKNV